MKVGLSPLLNRTLYEDYKRRLDAREVLSHYGAENISEIPGRDGTTELIHSCLLDHVEPHHRHGDQNPSAACNVDLKLYCCYSYWSGDLFHFIAKMERKDYLTDILPIIGDFLSGATSTSEDFLGELNGILDRISIEPINLPSYSPKVLEPWSYSHPYLREMRGIDLDSSSKLQIGFDPADNRIVFPHYWKGSLVGWQKRAIPAGPGWPGTVPDYPKYKNSTSFPKSGTLYGFHLIDPAKPVIVVESPMSVAKSVALGIPNVVATFGSKVSKSQINLLKDFDRVVIWFDDDPAGQSGERKLVTGLSGHPNVVVVEPDSGRDLGDCTSPDEVAAKLDAVTPAALRLAQYDIEARYRA